jgi:hypothetical protein
MEVRVDGMGNANQSTVCGFICRMSPLDDASIRIRVRMRMKQLRGYIRTVYEEVRAQRGLLR